MTLINGAVILLTGFLCVSLIINIILSWYTLNATRQIRDDQSQIMGLIGELEELQDIIGIYVKHLHSVAEMEMFYGDETLRELMRHGDAVVEAFQDYRRLYPPILEEQEEQNDDVGEENQDTEATATEI